MPKQTQSPFRWAGGKSKMLQDILEQMAPMVPFHKKFVDVFVGGGSVLLMMAEQYPNAELYCNDKFKWIASFWSVVSDTNDANLNQLLELMQAKPTIDLFNQLSGTPPTNIVEEAYRGVFFNRCCFSGIVKLDTNGYSVKSNPIGGKDQKSKWTVDCRYNIKKLRQKILACHELLKGRTYVECQDFSEYQPLTETNYPCYADPPYFDKGKMLYHEAMIPDEHIKLAEILNTRDNWVASYDDVPAIRELYKDQTIVDLQARYSI